MTRVVLVTGGSRGIGAEVAIGAARRGDDVVLSYAANEAAAEAVVAQVRALGRKALAVRADAASEAASLALFARIDREMGRLDVLVNNAGVLDRGQPFADYSVQRMQRIFETNVLGAFVAAREAVRRLSTRSGGRGGVIINVSSAAARLGAAGEYIDYAASKGAIDTLTLGLAREVADQGIRVNAVRPGLITTDIHASGGRPGRVAELAHSVPMQRGGTAREVADTILWLMSDEASYVTGAILDVSGGR